VNHSKERRNRAHVFVCVLSLLISRIMERRIGKTMESIAHNLNGLMVTPVKTRYGIIFMRSVSEDAGSVLKQMGIEYSEKILNSAQTA
jgi:transposase